MLRKTILDYTRDKLFDLRDELRATFVEEQWDLGSPIYKRLRDLVNSHLRFTEDFSIWGITYLAATLKGEHELQASMQRRIAAEFCTSNKKQEAFIGEFRKRAMISVLQYAVYSSGFLLCISIIYFPFVLATNLFEAFGRGVGAAYSSIYRSQLTHFITSAMASSSQRIASWLFISSQVETYSYRKGMVER